MCVLISNQVYTAVSRRDTLWKKAAQTAATLHKIAEDENKQDIRKVEAAKDTYMELRLILRELGVW